MKTPNRVLAGGMAVWLLAVAAVVHASRVDAATDIVPAVEFRMESLND
jgi:hypothetical protein